MNIKPTGKQGNEGHMILLGRLPGDFSSIISDAEVQDYVERRTSAEKNISVLNNATRTVILVSLQKNDNDNNGYKLLEQSRKSAYKVYSHLKDGDIDRVHVENCGVTSEEVLSFCEGLYLSDYQFNKYFTQKKDLFSLTEVDVSSDGLEPVDLQQMAHRVDGVFFARDLVNEPLSYLTATKLAEEIEKKGTESGFRVEVFNKKKIESLRMGGLLAVNKGSVDPPTFSILEWKPENPVNQKPYVLVGKGVVYDTGGMSLKPTHDSMDYMKSDMAGAAAVAGTIYSISLSELPVWIIGLIPATDNRPDGNAYVPGDVVTMYDGSTVEVLNTDAEGRMILADALSYAKQFDPELVIELSTLTGSAHAAVGKYAIVGMGNAGPETMESLKESGFKTFERIAEFPFWDDYAELLKSTIADQKNIGGRVAGAITAGKFLEKFTDYPFIHLDIAGPAFVKSEYDYRGKGGTGTGVRLLCDFFRRLSNQLYNE